MRYITCHHCNGGGVLPENYQSGMFVGWLLISAIMGAFWGTVGFLIGYSIAVP